MLSHLKVIPKDAIFQLNQDFKDDQSPKKINLGVGIYLNDEKESYVHPVIQKLAGEIDFDDFNYNTIQGHKGFLEEAMEFLYPASLHSMMAVQAVSGGTHGCALISKLLLKNDIENLILPIPTWGNHHKIFEKHNIISFDHLADEGVNFYGYKSTIKNAEPNSAILLHGGKAHNPTGVNLSLAQLEEIANLANENDVYVILDFAYLGLSEGMNVDLKYLHFLNEKVNNIASVISFSKNGTLYEHRVGLLTVKTQNKEALESHLQRLVRQTISQPAGFGQKIMYRVLRDYRDEWLKELGDMHDSIESRRSEFFDGFEGLPEYLKDTKGMFALLPFDKEKIQKLRDDFSIYMPSNGRINFGGLAPREIAYLKEIMKEL